jgi:transposase
MNNKKASKSSETTPGKCDVIKIGIDVHAHFVVATRQLDCSKAQPPQKFRPADFLLWIEKQLQLAGRVVTCYEAGPTGFWLHRELARRGVTNYVVCPTCLDSRGKGVNTDQTDASELCSRLDRHLAGNAKVFSVVRVPTEEEERRRVSTRQREQLREHRLSLAARGRTLMLLHGFRQGNQWWKAKLWERLSRELPGWMVERLEVFHKLIQGVEQEIKTLTASIEKAAPQSKPLGMGELTHEVIEREVADWSRFKTGRQAGSYAGLTGGVSGSGEQRADLGITKAGNKRLRTALVELAWRLVVYQSGYWLVQKWKRVLLNPKAHTRQRKRAIVAFARQLLVDLWKWKTGRATAESLGWKMTAAA